MGTYIVMKYGLEGEYMNTSPRITLLAILLYFTVSIALFNIFQMLSIEPVTFFDFILILFFSLLIGSLYFYWKYIFIAVMMSREKVSSFVDLVSLFILKASELFIIFMVFLVVEFLLLIIILIYIVSFKLFQLLYAIAWFVFILSIILEYIVAPYIILSNVYPRFLHRHGLKGVLILFTIPWFILNFIIGTLANLPFYMIRDKLAIYPYFYNWSDEVAKMIAEISTTIPIPPFGDLIATVAIAFYSRVAIDTF